MIKVEDLNIKNTAHEVEFQEQSNKIVSKLGNSKIEFTNAAIICEVRK